LLAAGYQVASDNDDRQFFQELGDRIRSFRKAQGLTQVQLAERLGYSQQQILSYEKGRRRMYVSVLPKLAEALSVSVEELLGCVEKRDGRGRPSKLQRKLERLSKLPRAKQQLVHEILDGVLAKAS